jgi:preprotein translocase subunit SecD
MEDIDNANGTRSSWTDAVMTSLAAALAILLSSIPKIIGFAVIVIIGWLIASAVATAVAELLRGEVQ